MSAILLDYQRLIEDIRAALTSGGECDDLAELAGQYATACAGLNDRLRCCQQLLAQGLRGEAIQMADAEPNVLDVAGVLDFPEVELWREKAALANLGAPPSILIEAATALNEAYALERPLAALLAKHRIQALARAPLAGRISVLRQIADLDNQNAIWRQDLGDYERARFREMQSDAETARKRGDAKLLDRLDAELNDRAWTIEPPDGLSRLIKEYRRETRRRYATGRLVECAQRLYDAYAAMDFEAADEAGREWEACWPHVDPAQSQSLLERAGPALEWLAERRADSDARRERERAVAELSAALDADTARVELDRLYHQVAKHEQEVPHLLERRYRERIRHLDLRSTRRTRVIAVVAAASVAAGAIGTWWIASNRQFAAAVAERTTAMKQYLANGQLSEAETYADDTRRDYPKVAATSEFAALRTQLESDVRKESERIRDFEERMLAAERAGSEKPDLAALTKAEELARLDQELLRVATLKRSIASVSLRQQTIVDEEFQLKLAPLSARTRKLETELDHTERQLDEAELRREINALVAGSPNVSAGVRQGAETLLARLDSLNEERMRRDRQAAVAGKLAAAVGKPERFGEALDEYCAEFDQGARTVDFRTVRESYLPWLTKIGAWNRAVESWIAGPLSGLDPKRAREILSEYERLPPDLASACTDADGQAVLAYLRSVGQRVGDDGESILRPLRTNYLANPYVMRLHYVATKDGARYYSTDNTEVPPNPLETLTVSCIVDFEGKKKSKRVSVADIAASGAAPHSSLADDCIQLLDGPVETSWEPTFYRLVTSVQNETSADEVFKYLLLRGLLEVAATGSSVWAEAFERHASLLKEADVRTDVSWLDPDDEDAGASRRLADSALERFGALQPSVADTARAIKTRLGAIDNDWNRLAWRWVGVALRDDAGEMEARGSEILAGPVFRLEIDQGGGARFVALAINGEHRRIVDDAVIEGEPLFVRGE